MKKRVIKLKRQDSKLNIISEHHFNIRYYEIDEYGSFYRNGEKTDVKPDRVLSKTFLLVDDFGNKLRFKLHQIILQTFNPTGLKNGLSVDHVNRNRLDNSLKNLRFATRKQQYDNRENSKYKYKKVKCLNNGLIYKSCKHAEKKLGLVKNTISRVARKERKSIRGYFFEYV